MRRELSVIKIATPLIFPSLEKNFSIFTIHSVVLSVLQKKLRKIKSKKTPPKAAISSWCFNNIEEYSSGWLIAKNHVSVKDISVVSATTRRGKINLIPNTAIKTPIVKKSILQSAFQFFSIEAFTTALSKERDISKTNKIKNIQRY